MFQLKNKYQPKYFAPHQYLELLDYCREDLNIFIEAYNPASVERRLLKMMNTWRIKNLGDLQARINDRPDARELFLSAFVVNVTELFREPSALKFLQEQLFHEWQSLSQIRIWIAGCSTGEDVYSLCVLLEEFGLLHRVEIVATDINPLSLEQAQERSIDLSKLQEAEQAYFAAGGTGSLLEYGMKTQTKFTFHKRLLNNVTYLEQDLYQSSPEGPFELVWCKNVLIYFQAAYQFQVINQLNKPLKKQGYLILGEQESMAFSRLESRFRHTDHDAKVYQKIW